MVQSKMGRVLTDLERDIEAELRHRPPVHESQPVNFPGPRVRAPALAMPDYVEHNDGATEIGKLSAEAIVDRERPAQQHRGLPAAHRDRGELPRPEPGRDPRRDHRHGVVRVHLAHGEHRPGDLDLGRPAALRG